MKKIIKLTVNGFNYDIAVKVGTTLLDVLRHELHLTGTKEGCGLGDCGACTVLLEGKPVNSCLILGLEVDGKHVTTIEGLASGEKLHPIQKAFVEKGAIQCGYCTPGMILAAAGLLNSNPEPTEEEIIAALDDNYCRCGAHVRIVRAVRTAADNIGA